MKFVIREQEPSASNKQRSPISPPPRIYYGVHGVLHGHRRPVSKEAKENEITRNAVRVTGTIYVHV